MLLERQLRKAGLLDDAGVAAVAQAAEELAAEMRAQFDRAPDLDPGSLFTHVYAQPTSQLREQAAELMAWQAADAAKSDDAR